MKRIQLKLTLALTLLPTYALAQAAEVPDILRQMVGCFRVTFNYVEDGAHDAFYQPVIEKAALSSENPITISRQLIIDGNPQRHWSEQWIQLEDRKWRQEVTGPFEDFRYACEGIWLLNQWSCIAERAPKPRRDQARPYAYLDRGNTLQVNGQRWVHSQNNRKLLEDGTLYSIETGWNRYERVEESHCQVNDGN